jgi:tRNA A37 threonylcarbamoyladenosine dehydratase
MIRSRIDMTEPHTWLDGAAASPTVACADAGDAPDFARRFGGIARLYGGVALDRFRRANVCVIGIGGVGSWSVEALARSAVGGITLIDLDHIAESNVNRQIHALGEAFGQAKVLAMAERIRAINPECGVTAIEELVSEGNLETLLGRGYDHVIDAIDHVRTKAAIIAFCRRRKMPLITAGGAGGQTDPTRIQIADLSRTVHDPVLAKVRYLLRRRYGFPREAKKKFGVEAIFSTEPLIYPAEGGELCQERQEGARLDGLGCAGFGSSMCVTAAFGLAAVSRVLNRLAREADQISPRSDSSSLR